MKISKHRDIQTNSQLLIMHGWMFITFSETILILYLYQTAKILEHLFSVIKWRHTAM